jgi:hypothetical protein
MMHQLSLTILALLVVTTAPLSAAEPHMLNAVDFGAVPNNGLDDRPALQRALNAARDNDGAVVLQVPPGVYHLDLEQDQANTYALIIRDTNGLTIEAEGVEFIVRSPITGFMRMVNSANITLRGFTIDYDPLPFTLGKVVENLPAEDAFIIEPLPGYPEPDHWQFSAASGWGYFLDPDPSTPGKLAANLPNVVFERAMIRLPDGRFRIEFNQGTGRRLRSMQPGTLFTRIVKINQLFIADACSHLRFENITSYASPSGHYVGNNSEHVTIINCRALVREGRMKGGNADGIHFQNTRGPFIVRDSIIDGISDDGLNLYQKPHFVIDRRGEREFRISARAATFLGRPGAGAFRVGDRLHAFNDYTGECHGFGVIAEMDRATGWSTMVADWDFPTDPETWKQIGLYNDRFASDVEITGNTFINSRRFGVYLKSHRAVVRQNQFINLSASGIVAMNDTGHGEGGFSHDVRIENNLIQNCGFSANFAQNNHWHSIAVFAQIKPHEVINTPDLHSNFSLVNNRIIDSPRGIFLQSIDGVQVRNNRFQPAPGQPVPDAFPLHIDACSNVEASNNRVEGR